MKQHPGFEISGKENLFCKLNRALYGFQQSGRVWYYEIDKVLSESGFEKLEWCNCAYVRGTHIVLLLYIDDLVFLGRNFKSFDSAVNVLKKSFDIKVLGKTEKLLRVEFEESQSLVIHRSGYIEDVIDRFKH